MNGYDRIKAALGGRPADKIPLMLHNSMVMSKEAGLTMEQFRHSPKAIAEAFIKSVEKYRYDGILIDIDTVTLAGVCGVEVDFPENEPARTKSLRSDEGSNHLHWKCGSVGSTGHGNSSSGAAKDTNHT